MNKLELERQLNDIYKKGTKSIEESTSLDQIKALKFQLLGRKSQLIQILRSLKDLKETDRKIIGSKSNEIRVKLNIALDKSFKILQSSIKFDLDVTAPGKKTEPGHLHPVTQAIRDITKLFERIGFYRVRYPEIEWDWYAFEGLNMPKDHPARDEWETFFIDRKDINPKLGKRVLTPHTSSGQVRDMEKRKPPIRMINIAKCYRRQIDISHTPVFHQFEGLVIDKNINITNLLGVLNYFAKNWFGPDRKARIRPFHFNFTEPSYEVDFSCGVCNGKGCRLCKGGWLELGGAGMVHPNVLKNGGIDPKKYSGFAFGWGVERTYMMKEGLKIPDIRILYQNDIRFLKQF